MQRQGKVPLPDLCGALDVGLHQRDFLILLAWDHAGGVPPFDDGGPQPADIMPHVASVPARLPCVRKATHPSEDAGGSKLGSVGGHQADNSVGVCDHSLPPPLSPLLFSRNTPGDPMGGSLKRQMEPGER